MWWYNKTEKCTTVQIIIFSCLSMSVIVRRCAERYRWVHTRFTFSISMLNVCKNTCRTLSLSAHVIYHLCLYCQSVVVHTWFPSMNSISNCLVYVYLISPLHLVECLYTIQKPLTQVLFVHFLQESNEEPTLSTQYDAAKSGQRWEEKEILMFLSCYEKFLPRFARNESRKNGYWQKYDRIIYFVIIAF